jgi:hypothetical protein
MASYNAVLDGKKEDIGPLNGYFWDIKKIGTPPGFSL